MIVRDKYTTQESYDALGGQNWVNWISRQISRVVGTKQAVVTRKINGDVIVTIGLKQYVITGKDEKTANEFRNFLRDNT